MRSMGLLRFHLLALQGSAVILMRLERLDEALIRLTKIAEMDQRAALGAAQLQARIVVRQEQGAEVVSP